MLSLILDRVRRRRFSTDPYFAARRHYLPLIKSKIQKPTFYIACEFGTRELQDAGLVKSQGRYHQPRVEESFEVKVKTPCVVHNLAYGLGIPVISPISNRYSREERLRSRLRHLELYHNHAYGYGIPVSSYISDIIRVYQVDMFRLVLCGLSVAPATVVRLNGFSLW